MSSNYLFLQKYLTFDKLFDFDADNDLGAEDDDRWSGDLGARPWSFEFFKKFRVYIYSGQPKNSSVFVDFFCSHLSFIKVF